MQQQVSGEETNNYAFGHYEIRKEIVVSISDIVNLLMEELYWGPFFLREYPLVMKGYPTFLLLSHLLLGVYFCCRTLELWLFHVCGLQCLS